MGEVVETSVMVIEVGYSQPGGGGSSAVASVNGHVGTVVLAASDVGAEAAFSVAGLLKSNGTTVSAAVANTDYAPPVSPVLTGVPVAPTAAALNNSTQIATTAYADGAVSTEKSRALAAEGSNAAAVTAETARALSAEALLAPLASPAFTGVPTAPTAPALTNTTEVATTAYTDSAVNVEKTRAQAAEGLLAPLASPALTGTPTAPTQAALNNSTRLATTAYADSAVSSETSRATTAEALLAPKASPSFTGVPVAPTAAALTNTTQVATTAYADGAVNVEKTRAQAAEALLAPLASPALTGNPTAPTQAALNNSTRVATTAYTDAAVGVEASRATTAEALLAPKASPTFTGTTTVSGGEVRGTASVTGATTLTATSNIVMANATSAAFSVTLPTAVGATGQVYTVTKTDSSVNAVTVATTSAQTINLATSYTLKVQYSSVTVQSDGSNWQVIGNHVPERSPDWVNVKAFGATGNGTTDDTTAIQAAINYLTGSANPATTTRSPTGALYLPQGTYKVSADIIIRSVQDFRMIGAGPGLTTLKASGTGFTTAVLLIDGSANGVFEGFQILGDTTEQVTDAIRLDWTSAANRSTTGNMFRDIRVSALKFVTGFSLEGNGSQQVDGTSIHNVVISGQQVAGSWSNTGNWQNGFAIGNGTFGNNYDHALYRSDAAGCYYGWNCQASGFGLFGAQPASNGTDFYINPGAQITVENVQSQGCGAFLLSGTGSALVPTTFRDVIIKSTNASGANWISLLGAGASRSFVFENISLITWLTGVTPVVPVISVSASGGGAGSVLTAINLSQANNPSSGISVSGGLGNAQIVLVNYQDLSTTPNTGYPFVLYNAPVSLPRGITGATAPFRLVGATTGGAPASGTFALGDVYVDQTGGMGVCTTAGTVGSGCVFTSVGQVASNVQWFTSSGTWTKPAGAQSVEVTVLADGSGGGSGCLAASGQAGGGGGGGAGGFTHRDFVAADLTSTVTVTVGTGGAGAPAVSSAGNGTAGTAGTGTFFGTYCWAHAGTGGGGGTAAAGGGGGAGGAGAQTGGGGANGGASAAGTASSAGVTSGGGGGGGTTGAAAAGGGASGVPYMGSSGNVGSGGVAGGASPTAGTNPAVKGTPSCGGGGGASAFGASSAGQAGATAFFGGGGGGGGGCSGATSTSGAGGAGGPGFCLVITHFS